MADIISIEHIEIPAYLQGSEFYCSLDLEAEEQITVPTECFKRDDSVANAGDLRNLLLTLRFWGVVDCPRSLLEYVLSTNGDVQTLEIIADFESELRYLLNLRELSKCKTGSRLALAMRQNNVYVAKFLLSRGAELNEVCFLASCESGSLDCLQLISDQCNKWWLKCLTVRHLIVNGYLDVIQYLHVCGFEVAYPTVAIVAASYGQLSVLRFYLDLHSTVVRTNSLLCLFAAVSGHLGTFQCAYEARPPPDARATGDIVDAVCYHGRLDMLMYIESRGVVVNTSLCCSKAARRGNLEILRYLHDQRCEFTADACTQAASNGHLDCLRYLHEHGCPWTADVCHSAVRYRHLHCAKYLLECGCYLDVADVMNKVLNSEVNHVPWLLLLHEYGAPVNTSLYTYAACHGSLRYLTYLHDHGVAWGDRTTASAAKYGHLDCMVYAHEHGCPWSPDTCKIAWERSHLACFQYAHEHGAPCDLAMYIEPNVSGNPA